MAVEKVGVYRRWLEPVPLKDGKPIPKSQCPKKRRHSWTVRWYGTNGKRYAKDFKKRKKADRCARELQSRITNGKQDQSEKITLHSFIREHERVMKGQVAYVTLYDQVRALRLFEKYIGGRTLLRRIRPSQAEGFVARRLASGVTVATANKDVRTLKRVFNLAIEPRGHLLEGQNPSVNIRQRKKAEKPVRYVSPKEYRTLLGVARKLWRNALISIACGGGLRRGEILNLFWTDVDFEGQQIHVAAKARTRQTIEWEPKDHENRVVPMSDETAKLLVNIQVEAEEGHPYIFISRERLRRIRQRLKGGRWNPKCEVINNLIRDFAVISRKAGVAKCTLHDLRRSAITNWAKHLPIEVVQNLAGHSDIATMRKYYLAVRSEDMVSAKEAVNKILAGRKRD